MRLFSKLLTALLLLVPSLAHGQAYLCPTQCLSSAGYGPSASGPGTPAWLNGANIGLNFALNQYYANGASVALSSLLTLTRATTATVIDSTNTVISVGSGAPARSDVGLNAWEARTNLALQSADLTNAAWATFINASGTLTRTANSSVSPDGTTTAALVAINRTAATDYAQISKTFTGTVASYTASLWIKAATTANVSKTMYLVLHNGTSVVGSTAVVLTSIWTQYSVTATLAASAGCQFLIGYIGGTGTGTGAVSYLAWGGQIELGSTASPIIPTTTVAVTRNADVYAATGALATLLASATGSIAVWSNSVDKNGVAKTLVDANGTVLLGVNTSKQLTTAVGATLATSNAGNFLGVDNFGFSWDASGGLFDLIGTTSTDSTARTPSGPFRLFSTAGTSNFWNGNVGIMLFYNTKQSLPQVALPSGVTSGFINRYAGSTLPGAAQYRNFYGLTVANGQSAIYLQNTGAYNAEGTNTPYISQTAVSAGTYFALTEGAISGPATRQQQWRNINLYSGSTPLTLTPNASNPAITALVGGLDDNFLLHPAITQAFAGGSGGAPFTAYYSAIDTGTTWRIFWATSSTALPGSWTKQGVAINANSGAGYANPGLPSIITVGSTVYMYIAGNGDAGNTILVFTSPTSGNGGTWTFVGTVLSAPVAGDWDFGASFVIDPFVYANKQGFYEMGFTSQVGGQKMGYAIASSPLGPFVRYPVMLGNILPTVVNTGSGDISFNEDTTSFYWLWAQDTGVLNGTSSAFGATLPPY